MGDRLRLLIVELPSFLKSEQVMSLSLGVALIVCNRKFNLGLTTADLAMVGGMIAALIFGESHKDAMAHRIGAMAKIADKVTSKKGKSK